MKSAAPWQSPSLCIGWDSPAGLTWDGDVSLPATPEPTGIKLLSHHPFEDEIGGGQLNPKSVLAHTRVNCLRNERWMVARTRERERMMTTPLIQRVLNSVLKYLFTVPKKTLGLVRRR